MSGIKYRFYLLMLNTLIYQITIINNIIVDNIKLVRKKMYFMK